MESDKFRETYCRLVDEIKKVIVGNDAIIARILIAFFSGGHVLLEGVPGLGKTLLVKSMSQALGLSFKRVQFTPDLMPSDIIGTEVLAENNGTREFQFKRGPIFAHVVLADEINRATPKTQSAVLEAMEERQVTVFGETHVLESPFMVLATQNPIELEGTYPLPEAQLDRFFFKLLVEAPPVPVLREILSRTTGVDTDVVTPILCADDTALLQDLRKLVRAVLIAPPIVEYVVQVVHKTQPRGRKDPASISAVEEYLRFGASPRGAQAVILGAKGHALTQGRVHVSYEDIEAVVFPALRHRLILNFQAEAENVIADDVLKVILQQVPRP